MSLEVASSPARIVTSDDRVAEFRVAGPSPVTLLGCDLWSESALSTFFQREERKTLQSMLLHPAVDQPEILVRQKAVAAVVEDQALLDALHTAKDDGYGWCASLQAALGPYRGWDVERYGFSALDQAPRLMQILMKAGVGPESWREDIERLANPDLAAEAHRSLGRLETFGEAVPRLCTLLESACNATLQAKALSVRRLSASLPLSTAPELIRTAMEHKNAEEIFASTARALDRLEDELIEVGTFIQVAALIRADGYCKVMFDAALPAYADGVWHAGYRRCGDSALGRDQVTNPALFDEKVLAFESSSRGGGTFKCQADLLMQLWAQTFGYAPAETAHCSVYDSFAYLARGKTRALDGLSAFGDEVRELSELLGKDRSRCYYAIDGLFETTSAEDRRALYTGLAVVAAHARNPALTLRFASGDERFHDELSARGLGRVMHMELGGADGSASGEPTFTVRPGAAPLAYHQSTLERVRRELGSLGNNRYDPAAALNPPPLSVKPIVPYDEAERMRLKERSVGFSCVMPTAVDAEIGVRLGDPILDWQSGDSPWCAPRGEHVLRLIGDTSVWQLAQESGLHRSRRESIDDQVFPAIMIHVPRLSAAETLERQALFAGLLRDRCFGALQQAAEQTELLVEGAGSGGKAMLAALGAEIRTEAIEPDPYEPFFPYKPSDRLAYEALFLLGTVHLVRTISEELPEPLRAFARWAGESAPAAGHSSSAAYGRLAKASAGNESSPTFSETAEIDEKTLAEFVTRLRSALGECDIPDNLALFPKDRICEGLAAHAELAAELGASSSMMQRRLAFLHRMLSVEGSPQTLLSALRSIDSVYAAQLANYFDGLLAHTLHGVRTGFDVLEQAPECPSRQQRQESLVVQEELRRLQSLCRVAEFMHQNSFRPVRFTDQPIISIIGARSGQLPRDEEVANSWSFSPEARLELDAGPNMVGKTFGLKSRLWLMNAALATGHGDAEEFVTCIPDRIVYFDRFFPKGDQSDVTWTSLCRADSLLKFLGTEAGFSLVLGDEPLSAVKNHQLRTDLVQRLMRGCLDRNAVAAFASHDHEAVDALSSAFPDAVRAMHYSYTLEPGSIRLDRTLVPGQAPSFGLEVARLQGLDSGIIRAAFAARAISHARETLL